MILSLYRLLLRRGSTLTESTVGISFDVAHLDSVCHWLAFPIAESYWEKQGQWNEAFELEVRTISQAYRSNGRYMTLHFRHRISTSWESFL